MLLHTFQGLRLWQNNRSARGPHKYALSHTRSSERSARNMAWFGIVIFIFLLLHLWQFWLQMKLGVLPAVEVAAYDHPVQNLYLPVAQAFDNIYYVLFYVVCMVVVGFHLWHGFWSSMQTLGLDHRKYTPLIKGIGYVYSIGMGVGFSIIPIVSYLSLWFNP